jgi:hypothetical protein
LNTDASIGSLGGKPPGFEKIELPDLKQKSKESDEDFKARQDQTNAAFAADPENRRKLINNLRVLQFSMTSSYVSPILFLTKLFNIKHHPKTIIVKKFTTQAFYKARQALSKLIFLKLSL